MTTHPQPQQPGPQPRREPRRRPSRRGAAMKPVARDLALLAARLTPRDRWIARMLAEHRVLTTHHLVGLAFPQPRPAQLRLATLAELGVIIGFQPLHGPAGSRVTHWVLDTAGHAVLAAEDGHPPPRPSRHSTGAAIAHNQQLGHQLGVNTCLTDLAKDTLRHPDTRLVAWWGQARCTRHFGDHTHPDAYLLLTHTPTPATATAGAGAASGPWGGYRLAAFVEYDTGTETLHRLAAKLAGYHRLTAATAINTPLLFHLPTPTREHNARAALTRALADLGDITCLHIATTHTTTHTTTHRSAHPTGHPTRTGTRRTTRGHNPSANAGADPGEWSPHTPAWAPLHPADPHLNSQRVSLADLAVLWTPTHPHHTHLDTTNPDTDTTSGPAAHPGASDTDPRRAHARFELAAPQPTPPPDIPGHPARHDR